MALVISDIHPFENQKSARDESKYNAILPQSDLDTLVFQTKQDIGGNAFTSTSQASLKALLGISEVSVIARAFNGVAEKYHFYLSLIGPFPPEQKRDTEMTSSPMSMASGLKIKIIHFRLTIGGYKISLLS